VAGSLAVTGNVRYGYIPDRPVPRKRHPVRRSLIVLGACVAVSGVIGWKLGGQR
jgi:hypothetical protein